METLAGLLLARLGHIPEPGESVEIAGRRLTVVEVDRRRIARVRVEELEPESEPVEKRGAKSAERAKSGEPRPLRMTG